MNIALVTILFFLFLFPGIFFTRFYYSKEFSKQYFKSSIFELLLSTLLPAILIHLLFLSVAESLLQITLDIEALSILLLDVNDTDRKIDAIKLIAGSVKYIVSYNIFIWAFSGYLGYIFKKAVRKWKLDRKYKLLRFQNEWHYLVTGEILDFPNGIVGESSEIDFVSIDALMETSEGPMIYSGIIQDYLLSKQGGLELLYLTEVTRRY